MNYFPQILNYISNMQSYTEILLVPKTTPVERRNGNLVQILDKTLSPEDIRDTLVSLRSNMPGAGGPPGKEGLFSFGVQKVGRIRVRYMTQRGSYIVSIVKVPYDIPKIEDIVETQDAVEYVEELIKSNKSGIVAILASNYSKEQVFMYSLLKHISDNYQKLIYIMERPISFLIQHNKSIIIQREVGMDIDGFEDGIKDARQINPDITYIGLSDIASIERISSIVKTKLGGLLFLYLPCLDEKMFARSIHAYLREDSDDFFSSLNKVFILSEAANGKLRAGIVDIPSLA